MGKSSSTNSVVIEGTGAAVGCSTREALEPGKKLSRRKGSADKTEGKQKGERLGTTTDVRGDEYTGLRKEKSKLDKSPR